MIEVVRMVEMIRTTNKDANGDFADKNGRNDGSDEYDWFSPAPVPLQPTPHFKGSFNLMFW